MRDAPETTSIKASELGGGNKKKDDKARLCVFDFQSTLSDPMILVLYELQVEQPPYNKAGEPQESRFELPSSPRREPRSLNLKPVHCTDLTAYHDPASAS
jgi:hypothetical protein